MIENNYILQNLQREPKSVVVRQLCDLKISFSLTFDLLRNYSLIFRFRGGRKNKNDWAVVQTVDPAKIGYCQLKSEIDSKFFSILQTGQEFFVKFLMLEPEKIDKGTTFSLSVHQTLAQSLVEFAKKIEIFLQTPDGECFSCQNSPSINITHEKFQNIRIIAPSIVVKDKKFDCLVRFEDKFKNLVEDVSRVITLSILSEQNDQSYVQDIRIDKSSKGVYIVKDLTIPNLGLFFIEIKYQKVSAKSNPILSKNKSLEKKLFWGFIHGHSAMSDGIRPLKDYFDNLLKAGLDFGTSTEHDRLSETKDTDFDEIRRTVESYNTEEQFVSFFAFEWGTWYTGGHGDICIYFKDSNSPIFRSELPAYDTTEKIINALKPYKEKALMIGHHTALRPGHRNWSVLDNDLEKLVEIYSNWGNQEYSFVEGNPLPPRYKFFGIGNYARKKGPVLEKKGSFVKDALQRGYKLGFTAGGDDHYGLSPSLNVEPEDGLYPPGIMALWAENLTRDSLWKALHQRKTYGTTGPRVIVEFYVEKFFMGDIIDVTKNSSLLTKRVLSFNLISPISIEKVEIIRNGAIFKSEHVSMCKFSSELIDTELFNDINLDHQNNSEKFLYYYLRIFLEQNNMAWCSPIWLVKKF